jgi:cell division protein FtsA
MLEQLSAGAVLTGGAVLLEGMPELAEEVLGMPIRIGYPVGVKGITQLVQGPQYSTGVGLVKFGAQAIAEARVREEAAVHAPSQTRLRSHVAATEIAAPPPSSRLWDWIKAAF